MAAFSRVFGRASLQQIHVLCRISESAAVCSSASVPSHPPSPHSPSISPPQSVTSGSSPVELASSQSSTSEVWLKPKHFHQHPDAVVAANSCSKVSNQSYLVDFKGDQTKW